MVPQKFVLSRGIGNQVLIFRVDFSSSISYPPGEQGGLNFLSKFLLIFPYEFFYLLYQSKQTARKNHFTVEDMNF